MGNERDVADNVRKLIGNIGFDTMLCTVESVDDETTCTVKTVESGAKYKKVKLNANINDDKGIYVFPKKDSYVLVTLVDKVNGFVSMFSDIEKVTLKIDDTVKVEIGGDAKISCDGNIEINGGENEGLVIIQKLTDKLNGLQNTVNSFVNAYNAHIHTTTATVGVGPAVGVISPTVSTAQTAQTFNKKDYENEKITH
jgi:hypothetical protein